MKKLLITAVVLSLVFVSCFDLDVLVAPTVFKPVQVEEYQLGNYLEGDFSAELGQIYPDTSIDILQEVTFMSGDNLDLNLYGMHLIHNDLGVSGHTIFYCHGNTYHLDLVWTRVKLLYHAGYNIFVFDYRGFGKSDGEITEAGWYQDTASAFEYVRSLGVPLNDITVYGFSLGSTAAVHIASALDPQAELNGLILEAPLGSADLYVQDALLLPLPSEYITDFELDNISRIKGVTIRLFWIHGTTDSAPIYHATHGYSVYANHPGQEDRDKYKILVPGGDHADLPRKIGFDEYQQNIIDFIERTNAFGP